MAAVRKPLPEGKLYHFNVIYNHARSRYSATPDTELSLQFVEFLVRKLDKWGFTECYYYDEHALPGRNVFEELFRVVNGSEWSFVILTKEFSSNCWVKYCQMAAFKNLIDKTKRNTLIPITVGDVALPNELEVNDVLSFDEDPTTWNEGHTKQLKRLERVLNERVSVAATAESVSIAAKAESGPIQEHGYERVRSERDHIIIQPQPSIQESFSSYTLNRHLEIDGSTDFDNTNGCAQHRDANDGLGKMGLNADMNPAGTSNHYPTSSPACSPTTDAATNGVQREQMQTGTGVKPSVTQSDRDQSENTHRAPTTSTSTLASGSTVNYEQVVNERVSVAATAESVSVAATAESASVAAIVESGPIQEHGDGRVKSERDHIIIQPQPSIQESLSSYTLNRHLEVDGSTDFDITDGCAHHRDANDGLGKMGPNTDMNPVGTSNHYPTSSPACSPTTDAATNGVQREQMQTGTVVKPSVTQSERDQSENTHRAPTTSTSTLASGSTVNYEQVSACACAPSELSQPHNLPVSSASRPVVTMSTNASPNSKRLLSPQESASQGRTTWCQLDQTEYKAKTQSSTESIIQFSSLTREATSGSASVESGPSIKMPQTDNSPRSGQPLNSSAGQSSLQSWESDIVLINRPNSVDGLIEKEVVIIQHGAASSVADDCSPRPELSHGKTEQNKEVKRLPYVPEYPEQRMNELKFDQGKQPFDCVSLSEDQDITLDQEWSKLQHENIRANFRSSITNEQMRQEEQLNGFNQRSSELEGPTLHMESLMSTCRYEPGESTEPKQIAPSSDAGYISEDNISNNHSISSSHHGNLQCQVHTDNSDGRGVKPKSVESDSNTHLRNSKYSGDVEIGNNQMDVVDLRNNEIWFSAKGKESKPEKVTDNKYEEEQVHVRGEGAKPSGSEANASFSMISTSRLIARGNTGYGITLLRSLCHVLTKTDMISSWS